MAVYETRFLTHAPLEVVADFHHDTRSLKRLTPPPVYVQLEKIEPLGENSISKFTLWFGPIPIHWTAVHHNVDPLHGFTDIQQNGPMQYWRHTHSFSSFGSDCTQIIEHIEYAHFPGTRGWITHVLFSQFSLRLMFLYRRLATNTALRKKSLLSHTESHCG